MVAKATRKFSGEIMSVRVQQVAELLREQVSLLIQKELSEKLGIITVTDVEIGPDFREATVYIALIDEAQNTKVLTALSEAAPKFQRILGKTLDLRYTPRLTFKLDDSKENINRVEKLLQEINNRPN